MTLNNKARENIIKETTKLIQKNGYAETSIQDIIKKSKAPKGSLYYYFPKGKDDIIISSLDRINSEFNKKFRNSISENDTLQGVLSSLVAMFKNKEKTYGTPSFRITLLALETIGISPEVSKKCGQMIDDWKCLLAKAIQETGFDISTSTKISNWFFTTLQGAICASVIHNDNTLMEITEQSIQLLAKSNINELNNIFG